MAHQAAAKGQAGAAERHRVSGSQQGRRVRRLRETFVVLPLGPVARQEQQITPAKSATPTPPNSPHPPPPTSPRAKEEISSLSPGNSRLFRVLRDFLNPGRANNPRDGARKTRKRRHGDSRVSSGLVIAPGWEQRVWAEAVLFPTRSATRAAIVRGRRAENRLQRITTASWRGGRPPQNYGSRPSLQAVLRLGSDARDPAGEQPVVRGHPRDAYDRGAAGWKSLGGGIFRSNQLQARRRGQFDTPTTENKKGTGRWSLTSAEKGADSSSRKRQRSARPATTAVPSVSQQKGGKVRPLSISPGRRGEKPKTAAKSGRQSLRSEIHGWGGERRCQTVFDRMGEAEKAPASRRRPRVFPKPSRNFSMSPRKEKST